MKILYIGDHSSSIGLPQADNDPEGCIALCLQKLGHQVVLIHEREAAQTLATYPAMRKADLLLFHKWNDPGSIRDIEAPRKCFWMFDALSLDCPSLSHWMDYRRRWIDNVLPFCTKGFMTDGDWVDQDKTGKLVWLTQGADNRVLIPPRLSTPTSEGRPPIIFAGMVKHGLKRARFIAQIAERYEDKFEILQRRHWATGYVTYGQTLADYVAGRIVLAPDGPQTDRYWSNRPFLMLGMGAFLIHPYCEGLAAMYPPLPPECLANIGRLRDKYVGLVFYRGFEECCRKIDYYLDRPEERLAIARVGHERTVAEHTYMHRVKRLLEEVMK